MRTRLGEALDRDLDIAMRAFNGTQSDRSLWASIAWRVGVEKFHYALVDKLKENDVDTAVLRSPAAVFQAFLNDRFPKNPPSPKASASALRAMADKTARQGGAA